jgi:hypothetical protein
MIYYPYPSDKPNKKFYIYTKSGKKIYFGDSRYEHYTQGHLDEKRKNNYINRHSRYEDFNDPDSAGFWSFRFLWLYRTYNKAYEEIYKFLKNRNII